MEFALCSPQLGDVDVKDPDRVALEPLLLGCVAVHVRQPRDAMSVQTSVQSRACQVRDRWLQRVQAVIQRQQGKPPEGDDDSLLFFAENG